MLEASKTFASIFDNFMFLLQPLFYFEIYIFLKFLQYYFRVDELKPFWLSLHQENFNFLSEICSILTQMDQRYLKVVLDKLNLKNTISFKGENCRNRKEPKSFKNSSKLSFDEKIKDLNWNAPNNDELFIVTEYGKAAKNEDKVVDIVIDNAATDDNEKYQHKTHNSCEIAQISSNYRVLPPFCSFIKDLHNIISKCPSVISVPPFTLGAIDVSCCYTNFIPN